MKKKKQSRESESESYSFEGSYPNIAAWVSNGGWVEIGYVEYTGSFVRALDEGGMIWEGVSRYESLDYALKALDQGVAEWVEEHG
ncbi:MAG: hypothetical protein ACJ754_18010 [Pyrinomonadaceae bacterium]